MPSRSLADAQAAARSAQEVGANAEPRAAFHLRLAEHQIARAEKLIARKKGTKAKRVLERAQADAELALELTRLAHRRAEASSALRKLSELEAAK